MGEHDATTPALKEEGCTYYFIFLALPNTYLHLQNCDSIVAFAMQQSCTKQNRSPCHTATIFKRDTRPCLGLLVCFFIHCNNISNTTTTSKLYQRKTFQICFFLHVQLFFKKRYQRKPSDFCSVPCGRYYGICTFRKRSQSIVPFDCETDGRNNMSSSLLSF
jgi:hypothetical protein